MRNIKEEIRLFQDAKENKTTIIIWNMSEQTKKKLAELLLNDLQTVETVTGVESTQPDLSNAQFKNVDANTETIESFMGVEFYSKYTGDKGYKLKDVADGKVSLEKFIAQLSDEDLCAMMRGEGMCSPKVTPGVAGAYGAVTDSLLGFGIPIASCSDGPSGIRMDCGTHAFSLPNGTCLACSFNEKINEELFTWEGLDLRRCRIDALLGPGSRILL